MVARRTPGEPVGKVEPAEDVVVVADDDETCRNVLARELATVSGRVVTARDGAEALDLLARLGACVTLLVTDRQMPRLDGIGLLEQARATGFVAPAIVVSGSLSEAHRRRIAHAGAVAMHKPLERGSLAALARELTRK